MESVVSLDSIERYRDSLFAHKGLAKNTVRAYVADVRLFMSEWLHLKITPLTQLELQVGLWLNHNRRTWAPRTMSRKITSLKSFLQWCGLREPLEKYQGPKAPAQEPHPLPNGKQDLLAMLNAAIDRDHRVLIALCGLTGLRISEALEAVTTHFDYRERTITVRGKGDVTRVVPVSDEAWEILFPRLTELFLAGGGKLLTICDRTARKAITTIAQRAHITRDVASHDLRATFATMVYNDCKDIKVVAKLLGHASVTTTMLYIKTDMAAMRAAVNMGGLE